MLKQIEFKYGDWWYVSAFLACFGLLDFRCNKKTQEFFFKSFTIRSLSIEILVGKIQPVISEEDYFENREYLVYCAYWASQNIRITQGLQGYFFQSFWSHSQKD